MYLVGFGPGNPLDRTHRAEAAIAASDTVVGYTPYLDRIRDLLDGKETVSSGMRKETERCREALNRAAAGHTVALISSGDAGIYGMAGLALEMIAAENLDIRVEIVPGVTAASAAGAHFGAPLMLDYATISLSNLLVPWEEIEKRLRAVIEADLVVALYNPRSHSRTEPFAKALSVARAHRGPETPVGIATAMGQPEEHLLLTTLGELKEESVNMHSIVILGNSTTRCLAGWFVNPRGYEV